MTRSNGFFIEYITQAFRYAIASEIAIYGISVNKHAGFANQSQRYFFQFVQNKLVRATTDS